MTDSFATVAELTARLSSTYTVPADAEKLLLKASELIDDYTRGSAQLGFDSDDTALHTDLSDATCDQVEYWLEVGEEHDIIGPVGGLQAGRVQIRNSPPTLAPRARRKLLAAGLVWSGIGSF